ncbi:NADPH-dependent FMN reductase [Sphingomonas rubra]|uniref:NAD(P)H-dependent FMN reductase n=1 Tax=Sphingomonas rubra TaxID=634430 RepID=A0A1I5T3C0_9SPHN|nr:NADPH-dependent FMN reductase [Sphingomonas rubra]SFP77341.1 NAD(P)H-dependent FMN reductase [Sphingomonas rubra]
MSCPSLLAISGSLRAESYSTALLRSLADAAAGKAAITVLTLGDVPMYNQDHDTDTPPEGVAKLRAAIAAADGLIVASPEYNHGIPGVLKNALDWASRPVGASTLTGKTALTMTSSPGALGGVRAHAPLNESLSSIGVRVVLRPQAVVGSVHQKMTDGRLTHPDTLAFLLAGLDELLLDIARPGAADREAD